MTLGVGLLVGALVLAFAGPAVLRTMACPRHHPAPVLAAWAGSLVAVALALVGAAVVLVLPDPSAPAGAVGLASTCLRAAVRGEAMPWVLAGRLALGALVWALVVRVLVVAISTVREERRQRRDHDFAVDQLAVPDQGVWWVTDEEPSAYSVGGRRPRVVATTSLSELGPQGAAAVLAHERAHLQGRHHAIRRLAVIGARSLPWLPLLRRAPAAVGVLVEMSADAVAARRCGHEALAGALREVTARAAAAEADRESVVALAAVTVSAHTATLARLAWLEHRHGARRWAGSPAVTVLAMAAATGPVVATVVALATVITLLCTL